MKSHKKIERFCLTKDRSIREVIARMDQNRLGIALIVDKDGRLLGTVTDGDARRAVLARLDLDKPVSLLLERKKGSRRSKPVTGPYPATRSRLLAIFKANGILHLPLVDAQGRVRGLATVNELIGGAPPLRALVMAGGKGTRLHPLTMNTPKPMLRVGDKPLMEIIMGQLRGAGIKNVHVSTHHRADKITKHFGDGREFGLNMSYIKEELPLGTAGALGMLEDVEETTLVMNGDVLTEIDFRAMLRYHREMRADLTMAVRQYDIKVPYGIIECEGPFVTKLTEKPTIELFVNAGIYLLEPSVRRIFARGERHDMTEIIDALLAAKRPVASFPVREYWLDIGQHEDYRLAQAAAGKWKAKR